ncbi:exported hypothetical protein [Actinacidiphila cocklensis]|uniref:Uncharacterized protein n=1 Tax=Actinacidiphila cocklensis TaxID=887465 RepID=A0A9W4DIQ9_9ACTN|nr:exported hypothetical protein [Actinacidiphila cocklensis]
MLSVLGLAVVTGPPARAATPFPADVFAPHSEAYAGDAAYTLYDDITTSCPGRDGAVPRAGAASHPPRPRCRSGPNKESPDHGLPLPPASDRHRSGRHCRPQRRHRLPAHRGRVRPRPGSRDHGGLRHRAAPAADGPDRRSLRATRHRHLLQWRPDPRHGLP